MTDIDALLARISAQPLDPRLSALDAAIFAGLDRARTPVMDRIGLSAITALALMLGVMAGTLPANYPPASSLPTSPLRVTVARADPLAVDALAPSTLLADAR